MRYSEHSTKGVLHLYAGEARREMAGEKGQRETEVKQVRLSAD